MDDRPFVDGVIRHRRWVRIALRACVIVLVFVALKWAAHWAAWALSGDAAAYGNDRAWYGYASTIAFYGLAAALLVVGEPTIVRWVVPNNVGGCLGCGYPAAGASRCPECGLPVPGPDAGGGA